MKHVRLILFEASESSMEKEQKGINVTALSPNEALNPPHGWKATGNPSPPFL